MRRRPPVDGPPLRRPANTCPRHYHINPTAPSATATTVCPPFRAPANTNCSTATNATPNQPSNAPTVEPGTNILQVEEGSPSANPIDPVVAVVILTWNGRVDTLACLSSLARSNWEGLDIIVVDNGSQDGTEVAVKKSPYTVTFVQNGHNLGFAGGNNVGIAVALDHGADLILVLNNDTVVPPDGVDRLVQALEADPRAGACSPVLTRSEEPTRLWFAGSPYEPRRARAGRASPYELGATPLPDEPFQIDRAVGAAMLVRREVVERIGSFSEDLFFLHEDVDWSLRMRAAGWHILLVPDIVVAHKVAASQAGEALTPTTAYYGTRNDLEVARRHGGLHACSALWREIGCVVVHVAGVRRAPPRMRMRCTVATVQGWIDFRHRRLGARDAR